MFGKLIDSASRTASDFASDPIGESYRVATQPIRDGLEVADGLTEGELRERAALRLGADVASGMALGELIDWYNS